MTWHAKRTGAYYMGSTEADENAREAMSILMNDYNWTFAACCGLFGNIDFEGQWNPWRWQSDTLLNQAQARNATGTFAMLHGYGLIGWTPAKKYQFNNAETDGGVRYFPNYDQESYSGYGPNWNDVSGLATDGAAQIKLIGEAMSRGSGNIWVRRKNCTAYQFTQLNDPRQAAYYWLWNAEFPEHVQDQEDQRMEHGYAWYQHLGGSGSGCPIPILFKRAIEYQRGIL